jgi:hypothetical protein
LKASARRPAIGRALCRLVAGGTREVPASGGAASRPLRTAELAQQARKLQWQGCVNDIGRRGAEHVADRGENELARGRVAKIDVIGESERARVAGPQHGCPSHFPHVET